MAARSNLGRDMGLIGLRRYLPWLLTERQDVTTDR